jgi:1,4-alpha-glucan branching enzyme
VNYDADQSGMVREFVIQNAIYWMAEFRFDGLRLDAVHAIKDDGESHIVDELASRVRNASQGRNVHLGKRGRAARAILRPAAILHRAMERRYPPCAAHGGDWRELGILRGLCRGHGKARARACRRICLPIPGAW